LALSPCAWEMGIRNTKRCRLDAIWLSGTSRKG
jgi:hypothetical protein